MAELSKKTQAFEYFVYQLQKWYIGKYGSFENNDFSILKVLKLLFFCSAIEAEKDKDDTLLDIAFDNFYAMPYGHVESDVYNAIRGGELSFFKIDRDKTTLNSSNIDDNNFTNLSNNIICENKIRWVFQGRLLLLLKSISQVFDIAILCDIFD